MSAGAARRAESGDRDEARDGGVFLDAKCAGGRGEKTINDYRKKLDLFQRWLALRAGPEEVDVLYAFADADAVEAYAGH